MSRLFSQCPRCGADLATRGATSCPCGWKKRANKPEIAEHISVDCAHAGCPHEAILSMYLKTGWANLCRAHYEHHVQLAADEFNRVIGLDTRVKKVAFVREKLAAIRQKGLPLRVPGQDDEERALNGARSEY